MISLWRRVKHMKGAPRLESCIVQNNHAMRNDKWQEQQSLNHMLVCLCKAPNFIIGKWLRRAMDVLVWIIWLRRRLNWMKGALCGVIGMWDSRFASGTRMRARRAPARSLSLSIRFLFNLQPLLVHDSSCKWKIWFSFQTDSVKGKEDPEWLWFLSFVEALSSNHCLLAIIQITHCTEIGTE